MDSQTRHTYIARNSTRGGDSMTSEETNRYHTPPRVPREVQIMTEEGREGLSVATRTLTPTITPSRQDWSYSSGSIASPSSQSASSMPRHPPSRTYHPNAFPLTRTHDSNAFFPSQMQPSRLDRYKTYHPNLYNSPYADRRANCRNVNRRSANCSSANSRRVTCSPTRIHESQCKHQTYDKTKQNELTYSRENQSLVTVSNDCPICKEKLISVANHDIGATVPCGHCFHWQCFQTWKSFSRQSQPECPICRRSASDFIRIFVTSEINKEESKKLDEEVGTALNQLIDENESLKKKQAEMEHKIKRLKEESKTTNGFENLLVSVGSGLQHIGNGITYIGSTIKRGCRRPNDESRFPNNELLSIPSEDSYDSSYESMIDGGDYVVVDSISLEGEEIRDNDSRASIDSLHSSDEHTVDQGNSSDTDELLLEGEDIRDDNNRATFRPIHEDTGSLVFLESFSTLSSERISSYDNEVILSNSLIDT